MTNAHSLHTLDRSDPAWLRTLTRGSSWVLAGIFGSLVLLPLLSVVAVTRLDTTMLTDPAAAPLDAAMHMPFWVTAASSGLLVILSIVFMLGCWWLTEPEPGAASLMASQAITRWTTAPAFAINIPASLMVLAVDTLPVILAALAIKLLAAAVLSIGFPASLIYLRELARRAPAPRLAGHTTVVFWGQFAAGLLLIGCLLVALIWVALSIVDEVGASGSSSPRSMAGPAAVMLLGFASVILFVAWWVAVMLGYRLMLGRAYRQAIDFA